MSQNNNGKEDCAAGQGQASILSKVNSSLLLRGLLSTDLQEANRQAMQILGE